MATNIEDALSGGGLSVSAKPVTMEALPEAIIDVGGGSQSLAIEGLGVKRKKDDLSVTTSSTSQIEMQDLFGDLLDEVNFSDPSSVDAFRSSAQTRIDEMDLNSINRVLGTASSVAGDISTLTSPFLNTDSSQNQFQQVFGPPAPTSLTDSGGFSDVSAGSASGSDTEGIGSSRDFADLSDLGDPSFAASAFGSALGSLGPGGSLGSFAAGQLGSSQSLSAAAQAFGGFQSLQTADITDPAGALGAVAASLGAARGVAGLIGQAKDISSIFSDVEKTVSNVALNAYNAITNPNLAMEAYGRKMAYGTQFPDLYSFETKQGLATFAFDAKTGQIATPGLISGMLPGALNVAFSLSKEAAKEFGYAEAMQARNAAAIEAYTAPALETPNTSLSVYSSPSATASFDAATGKASISGAFASIDLGQQGFGQVGFDLGALADAMGEKGTVDDLSFTDYQDAAISGTLGHGPLGFDAYDEQEALAQDISYSLSEAGMSNAASMASNAAVSADMAAAAAAAYDQARGIDFSYSVDLETTMAGQMSASRAFDAKDHPDLVTAINSMVADIQKEFGWDLEMGLDREALTALALEEEPLQAAIEQVQQMNYAAFIEGTYNAGVNAADNYNSQNPNIDVVEAMQNLGFNYTYGKTPAQLQQLGLEVARIKQAAKGEEGSEGFSGSARGSGGVDEAGYSDAATTEAFDAFGAAFDAAAETAAASAAGAPGAPGAPGAAAPGSVGLGYDFGYDYGYDEGDGDCFVQGTLVLMAEGSTKAIEKVVVGDLVAGKDGNANTVKATHIKKPDIPFLYGFNGHKPFVTAYHPFMTKEGWGCFEPEKFKEHRPTAYQEIANEQGGKDLIKIKNNCEILRSDNEWVLVEDIVVEGCDPNLTVYNLSVANDKTFVANSYIVHNKGESGKIICTAMNNMYGFGSYRNALWMKYQSSHMAAEEYELGYHKLVMPLVKKMPTNKTIRTVLERIAKRRTINIRKELRGQKLPLYYRSMKYTVRPLLFAVGWLVKKNLLSKTEI